MKNIHGLGIIALVSLAACGGDIGLYERSAPPEIDITAPISGDATDEGVIVDFAAIVTDPSDDVQDLSVRWYSNRDGLLVEDLMPDENGAIAWSTKDLSPGLHSITATVTDPEGETGEASIAVTIIDLPSAPQVTFIHPYSGETGLEGELFRVSFEITDDRDGPNKLHPQLLSDLEGLLCEPIVDANGQAYCDVDLMAGTHELTVYVEDRDGYETEAHAVLVVADRSGIDDDGDGFNEEQGDCNDDNDTIYPAAPETCNGADDDCDGATDEGVGSTWYRDADGDGYGNPNNSVVACSKPSGYVSIAQDCNDSNYYVKPSASESCNSIDDDCDGSVDEGVGSTWYRDADGDGYGVSWNTTQACSRPSGYASGAGDCYDSNSNAKPNSTYWGTTHRGDGSYDYDCDGSQELKNSSSSSWYCDDDSFSIWWGSGWTSGRPACGQTGYWGSGCDYTTYPFYYDIHGPGNVDTVVQACQ